MEFLPVFLNVKQRRALVVGGGSVAARKAALLTSAGARVILVSPKLKPALAVKVDAGQLEWIAEAFRGDHLQDVALVIAATSCRKTNREVYQCAMQQNVPVNVADQPELCSFILPAIVDRSPVMVAVSTGGRSPVLARRVKAQLERLLPAGLGKLAEFCGQWRECVRERIPDAVGRRRFWQYALDSGLSEQVYAGRQAEAGLVLERVLSADTPTGKKPGRVSLVGAGPGDPELLTLKGHRLLQDADVVLFDRLVPVGILELCRREAEMIYVGKKKGDHPVPQQDISRLLVTQARQGRKVVRLKGGDPFIFGRGGEELEALVEAGIDFEVVPGISSALGSASYAGIPLTHRDHAQSVSFWTGHTRNGTLELDWSSMTSARQTLVFFMGASNAPEISRSLIQHGRPAATPVAVVQAATTPRQRVLKTSLHGLRKIGTALSPGLPTLIVVGSVVNLAESLAWFEGDGEDAAAVFPPHLSAEAGEAMAASGGQAA